MLSVLKLLILQLFFCWSIPISMTLPITSKPIENTPENLAYLEFLKLGTLNQDKNRRVSPKSIFVVPQRIKNNSFEHPPTLVHINREEILIAQLTNLLHAENKFGAQPSISYEYDYDYGEDAGGGGGGGGGSGPIDNTKSDNPVSSPFIAHDEVIASDTQKQVEPLKVQIFFDKFPISIEGANKEGENLDVAESNNNNNFWLVTNATATASNTKVESTQPTVIGSENVVTTTARAVTSQVLVDGFKDILPNKATTIINDNYSDDYLADTEGTTKINDNEMELFPPFVEVENKSDIKKSMVDESLLVDESVTGISTILFDDSTETVDLLTATDQIEEDQTFELTTKLPNNEWTTVQNWNTDDRFEQSTTDLSETIMSTIRTSSEDTTNLNIESLNANKNENTKIELITTTPTIPTTINNNLNKGPTQTLASISTSTTTIKPNVESPPDAKKIDDTGTTTTIDTTQTNMASNKRFVYHHLSTSEKQTDLVKPKTENNNYNFDEQMKIINRIVAENRKKNEQNANIFYINQQQQQQQQQQPKQSSLPPIFRAMSGKTTNAIATLTSTSTSTTTSTSTSTSTTPITPTTQKTTTTTENSNQNESYWWLPGWKTNQNGEKPLLLRFWSNVPGL